MYMYIYYIYIYIHVCLYIYIYVYVWIQIWGTKRSRTLPANGQVGLGAGTLAVGSKGGQACWQAGGGAGGRPGGGQGGPACRRSGMIIRRSGERAGRAVGLEWLVEGLAGRQPGGVVVKTAQ